MRSKRFKNYKHYNDDSCNNCTQPELLYDSHHDQVFCKNCGSILSESGITYTA